MSRNFLKAPLVAALLACSAPTFSATLAGSQVSAGLYCCAAPPGPATLFSNIVTATVGPSIEFPDSSLFGAGVTPVKIDVGATTIDIAYSSTVTTAAGSFNGYVFEFSGAPTINGVSVGSISTVSPVGLSFTANTVLVNLAATSLTPSSRLLVNVQLAPVPEPATAALAVFGLLLVGAVSWRNKS
jgi:hypothetical protein